MAFRIYYMLLRAASSIRYFLATRFTLAGQFVLVGIVVTGILGLDTNRNVAYQVFTFLLALLLAALAYNRSFRPRIAVQRTLPRTGTVGIPIPYRLTVRNIGSKVITGIDLVEQLPDPRPTLAEFRAAVEAGYSFGTHWATTSWYRFWKGLAENNKIAESAALAGPPIPPRSEVEVRMEIMPLRRGRLELSDLIARRADPFGLANGRAFSKADQSLLIIPRRYALPDITLPGTRAYQRGGVTLSNSVADSEEFQSLREYRPGDPPRLIHWKSWARAGKPVIKEFQDEFFVRHALVLDTFFASGRDDLFEEAVSIAASFACTVQTQESLLDLMFVGAEAYCETAGRGQGRTERLLEVLACVKACRDKPYSLLSNFVLSRRESMSGCICVLLAWDEDRKRFVEQLISSGVTLMAMVVTDRERANIKAIDNAEPPAWLHVLELGKIEEGLARL